MAQKLIKTGMVVATGNGKLLVSSAIFYTKPDPAVWVKVDSTHPYKIGSTVLLILNQHHHVWEMAKDL